MTYPILVILPFGDADKEEKSQERKDFEDRMIDVMLQDEIMAELAFYDSWYFYPYRNPKPRGEPLTPKEVFDVLKNELDLFLPKMESVEEVKKQFSQKGIRKQQYKWPYVPAHTNRVTGKEQVSNKEQSEWSRGAFVIIADDIECKRARLIHVSDNFCQIRLLRRFHRQGENIEGAFDGELRDLIFDNQYISDVDEEEEVDDDSEVKIRMDFYEEEHKIASDCLGFESPHECYLYGISAAYFNLNYIQTAVTNIENGNLNFNELMERAWRCTTQTKSPSEISC